MLARATLPLVLCAALALALSGCIGVEQTFEGPPTATAGAVEPEPEDAAETEEDAADAAETDDADAGAEVPASGDALELPIGAAFALSGGGSSFGQKGEAALALAEEMLAEGFSELVTVPPIQVQDTETDPERALEIVQAMHEEGIRIVIGPQTSANTAAVKDFADENGMILISPSSVARALSIPDDNVFRMTPDDALQAEAMTTMLREDSLSKVFVVHRDDLWGEDLSGLVAEILEADSEIELDVRTYVSAEPETASWLPGLAADVEAAVAERGAEAVGVYLLSFGEGAGILAAASAQPGLDAVRWYGSSAVAQSSDYLQDPAVVAFAETVGYPSPVFGLDPSTKARWEQVRSAIQEATGEDADIYALATYDALWLAALAALDAERVDTDDPAEALRVQIPSTAGDMVGVTGPLAMNEAGDRAGGTMDFWALQEGEDGPGWVRVAIYDGSSGTLDRDVDQP